METGNNPNVYRLVNEQTVNELVNEQTVYTL